MRPIAIVTLCALIIAVAIGPQHQVESCKALKSLITWPWNWLTQRLDSGYKYLFSEPMDFSRSQSRPIILIVNEISPNNYSVPAQNNGKEQDQFTKNDSTYDKKEKLSSALAPGRTSDWVPIIPITARNDLNKQEASNLTLYQARSSGVRNGSTPAPKIIYFDIKDVILSNLHESTLKPAPPESSESRIISKNPSYTIVSSNLAPKESSFEDRSDSASATMGSSVSPIISKLTSISAISKDDSDQLTTSLPKVGESLEDGQQ